MAVEVTKTQPSEQKMTSHEVCNQFVVEHSEEESAIRTIVADIYMSAEDASDTSVFANMDTVSLTALANGGDKDALFFLGDGKSQDAIFGKNWYGPKEQRLNPSQDEIKRHKVELGKLKQGAGLLFESGIRGKIGAFVNLKTNNSMAARQLIQTQPELEFEIKDKLSNMLAFNQLLVFIHKADQEFQLMFSGSASDYDYSELKRHFNNWKADLSSEEFNTEIEKLERVAFKKFKQFKVKWTSEREFLGLDVHPKLLTPELNRYLIQKSNLCSN